MADVEIEVPSPLRDCFKYCEVVCVRECCGIDAIATDKELIANWVRQAGAATNARALRQLGDLISMVEDRSRKVSLSFLNHYTCDESARRQLLEFFEAFQSVLESAGETGAAADQQRQQR